MTATKQIKTRRNLCAHNNIHKELHLTVAQQMVFCVSTTKERASYDGCSAAKTSLLTTNYERWVTSWLFRGDGSELITTHKANVTWWLLRGENWFAGNDKPQNKRHVMVFPWRRCCAYTLRARRKKHIEKICFVICLRAKAKTHKLTQLHGMFVFMFAFQNKNSQTLHDNCSVVTILCLFQRTMQVLCGACSRAKIV